MKVKVTQEHIDKGRVYQKDIDARPGSVDGCYFQSICECCPVALAVCDAVGVPVGSVTVFPSGEIRIDGAAVFSREAADFIGRFDAEGSVGPFEFEIPA